MQTEWDTAAGESRNVDLAQFSIGAPELALLKRDAIIMHPLPRGSEIDPSVDQDPRAMYWRQERNGMWMRVAVLIKIFGAEDRIAELEA
jgi:aspartate carbamoyltransferase catalytic subunit